MKMVQKVLSLIRKEELWLSIFVVALLIKLYMLIQISVLNSMQVMPMHQWEVRDKSKVLVRLRTFLTKLVYIYVCVCVCVCVFVRESAWTIDCKGMPTWLELFYTRRWRKRVRFTFIFLHFLCSCFCKLFFFLVTSSKLVARYHTPRRLNVIATCDASFIYDLFQKMGFK